MLKLIWGASCLCVPCTRLMMYPPVWEKMRWVSERLIPERYPQQSDLQRGRLSGRLEGRITPFASDHGRNCKEIGRDLCVWLKCVNDNRILKSFLEELMVYFDGLREWHSTAVVLNCIQQFIKSPGTLSFKCHTNWLSDMHLKLWLYSD